MVDHELREQKADNDLYLPAISIGHFLPGYIFFLFELDVDFHPCRPTENRALWSMNRARLYHHHQSHLLHHLMFQRFVDPFAFSSRHLVLVVKKPLSTYCKCQMHTIVFQELTT